jgi:hypothetical protein
MAWTNIDDTFLEPGKPLRSADLIALRDNAVAIAQGLSGAPKVTNNAFDNLTIGAEKLKTGTTERDWVVARTASASAAAVGTYAFLTNSGSFFIAFGSTVAGSLLTPISASGSPFGGTQSGTWRCMGFSDNSGTLEGKGSLFLRIS